MYRLSIIPRGEGDTPREELNGNPMESINKTNYITSVDDKETRRDPISIVSFLRHPNVDFNIDNDEGGYDDHKGVHNFVVDVYNADLYILEDIRYIFSCAILIQLNSHYQTVIDWTTRLKMVPDWSENSFPRKIDTAWKFDDITGSPEIKKSETDDLKLRLRSYHDNLDAILNEKDKQALDKYQINKLSYPKRNGGSKTKKQKKQRQRKQKSKRKKTNRFMNQN
jgi:hypothetical protein